MNNTNNTNGGGVTDTMNKNQVTIGVIIAIVLIGLLVWAAKSNNTSTKPVVIKDNPVIVATSTPVTALPITTTVDPIDVKNQTYTIDSRTIVMDSGVNMSGAVGTSSLATQTTVLDGSAFTDIDGDGSKDAVVILRDNTGGSGTFYYVAGVLSNHGSTRVTNAVFLGDRIRVKEINVLSGVIKVDIMDRNPEDSFATPATVAKTITLGITNGVLSESK